MSKYLINEKWKLSRDELREIFNIESLLEVVSMEELDVALDDEILKMDVFAFNMPIFNRAFNEDLSSAELCRENIHRYHSKLSSKELRNLFSINLSQAMIYGNYQDGEHLIALHIAKLRKNEMFINDIVLKKNRDELIGKNLLPKIIGNLKFYAKKNKIKYISAHAMNKKVLNKFLDCGFKVDKRSKYGNDWLFKVAKESGEQYPCFLEIK